MNAEASKTAPRYILPLSISPWCINEPWNKFELGRFLCVDRALFHALGRAELLVAAENKFMLLGAQKEKVCAHTHFH
jgi:hypothetical protein